MRMLQTSFASTLTTTLCLTSTMAVLALLHTGPPTDHADSHAEGSTHRCGATSAMSASGFVEFGADGEGEGADRPSLVGQLLVASPGLADPYFTGTVIYMLADDEHGAVGVVVNRARDHVEHQDVALWDGGPVGRTRVFVLHDDVGAPGSVRVGDVAVESDPAVLDDLFSGRGPKNARVFVGYAGWGPGQLDGEIAEGAWRTASAPAGLVLSTDISAITARTYAQLVTIY